LLLNGNVLHAAIHLVGRTEDDCRLAPSKTGGLQDVEGAERVYLEIGAGIGNGCRYCHLPGQVIDHAGVLDNSLYGCEISDIAPYDAKLRALILVG
jgi:hypothetical protein